MVVYAVNHTPNVMYVTIPTFVEAKTRRKFAARPGPATRTITGK